MAITINITDGVGDTLRRLQLHDSNLSSSAMPQTAEFCDVVFNENKPIHDLLAPGPVNIGGIEWDFEFRNGIRSLVRRGFYKIVGTPFQRDILDIETGRNIPTWSAQVLYCPEIGFDYYLRFVANVGPMVNINAIGFNFTNYGERLISMRTLHVSKQEFFNHMIEKVFYVSQQMHIDGRHKQTVWFKFK